MMSDQKPIIVKDAKEKQKRRIIVCLDGTWETPEERTNVYKFFHRIDTTETDEWEYVAEYYSGLGTHWRHPLMGGLFGYGISGQILRAYQFICNAYRDENDEIWLLGFSRGAFAARSLAGMINNVGLLPCSTVSQLAKRAFRLYRNRSKKCHPNKRTATEFRDHNQCRMPVIQFIGCFDTVGALGMPKLPWYLGGSVFYSMFFGLYGFHDLRVPPIVKNAFHAIAIHDQRAWFRPTLMYFTTDCSPSVIKEKGKQQHLEQVWFPGMHSDVGGGEDDNDDSIHCFNIISHHTLHWMMEKAAMVGLRFLHVDEKNIKPDDDSIDSAAVKNKRFRFKYTDSYETRLIYKLMPRQDRVIEPDASTKEYKLEQLYNNGDFSSFLTPQQLGAYKSKTLDVFYKNLIVKEREQ